MTDVKHLEETLAIFGADSERWPAGHAAELDAVLRSPEGVALVAEAQALAQVLDAGGNVVAGDDGDNTDALLASIMSSTVDAEVSPADKSTSVSRTGRRSVAQHSVRLWGAGVGMAAALLIGVFAGLNGFGAVVTTDGISIAQGDVAGNTDDALFADLSFLSDAEFGDVDAGDDV